MQQPTSSLGLEGVGVRGGGDQPPGGAPRPLLTSECDAGGCPPRANERMNSSYARLF